MADRILALVSPEHEEKIVWKEDSDDNTIMTLDNDDNEEDSDRLFTFEVAKTNEQEENVMFRPGFMVSGLP